MVVNCIFIEELCHVTLRLKQYFTGFPREFLFTCQQCWVGTLPSIKVPLTSTSLSIFLTCFIGAQWDGGTKRNSGSWFKEISIDQVIYRTWAPHTGVRLSQSFGWKVVWGLRTWASHKMHFLLFTSDLPSGVNLQKPCHFLLFIPRWPHLLL